MKTLLSLLISLSLLGQAQASDEGLKWLDLMARRIPIPIS